jgi:glycerol-3-phosphate acyltransferase PlsY
MTLSLLAIAAYLIGSIPFAIVASRLFRLDDPRKYGSGNPGATNVLRSGNKGAAVVTLIGDCAKGWFAVWAAVALGFSAGEAALAGLFAFLGHVFSIFLRFKGGKGVATALGVIAGINPWIALIALTTWLLVALTTRYSSLAALGAAAIAPIAALTLGDERAVFGVLLVMSAILVFRHRDNIRKLKNGTEGKIGAKKS